MADQAKAKVLPGDELAQVRNKGDKPIVIGATSRDRGIGPFKRLALRSATIIDGTGAPPIGPIDIMVEDGRIVSLKKVAGYGAGLVGLIAIKVLAPGFYANQDMRTPVRIAIIVLVITQLMNIALVPWLRGL